MAKSINPVRAAAGRLLWRAAMRSVTPLPGRMAPVAPPPSPLPTPRTSTRDGPAQVPVRSQGFDHFRGIDRANAERLKRGRHPVEARLDLHGKTQAEAHQALAAFIHGSSEAGLRCVLVITGRGLGPSGPGVLRSVVPRWLQEAGLRQRILAMAPAQPRDGGAGAFYLLLRRQRNERRH